MPVCSIITILREGGSLTICQDYVWKHRKDPNDKATTEPGFDFEVWKDKHIVSAREIVPKWVKAVTEQYAMPKTKFACVGYVPLNKNWLLF